jgi:prepilin-type N-terminal cleavage/methylation domain-containing protein/prepilin-type processing-associated H-X9-DG protein
LKSSSAFSLIESLAVVVVVAVLATLGLGAYRAGVAAGDRARSASNLKVLILATKLYAVENHGEFPRYREDIRGQEKNGIRWWFGLESWSSTGRGEGQREIDGEGGPLGPYLGSFVSGGPCPGLVHEGRVVPKYKNSRNFGYGYNEILGPDPWQRRAGIRTEPWRQNQISQPSQIAVFGTSAQRKPGYPPPTLEEFYLINERERTVHARFGKQALFAFADGHVGSLPLVAGSEDPTLGSIKIGRVARNSLDPALQP